MSKRTKRNHYELGKCPMCGEGTCFKTSEIYGTSLISGSAAAYCRHCGFSTGIVENNEKTKSIYELEEEVMKRWTVIKEAMNAIR